MGLKYQDVLKFYMNPDIVNSPRPVISNSEAILIKCSMMIIFSKVFQFCENSLVFPAGAAAVQMMKELTK